MKKFNTTEQIAETMIQIAENTTKILVYAIRNEITVQCQNACNLLTNDNSRANFIQIEAYQR